MTQLTLDRALALKDKGMELAASGNDAFLAAMRSYAIARSKKWGHVTADDVRVYAEVIGLQPTSPHVWGSVFKGKGWECVGHHLSMRVANHGHQYRIWRWVGG